MSSTLENTTLRGATQIVGTLNVPAGSITADDIATGADIPTSKTVHRHVLQYSQAGGASVADATVPIHIARGTTGTLIAVEVAILTAAIGDSTVTVDLQKSTGGGAFASMLTAVVEIDSSTVVRTAGAATLDSTSFTDGDILELIINATAGTGTLPQGLIVTVTLDETPA